MFAFIGIALAKFEYSELPISNIVYPGGVELNNISFENAYATDEGVYMKASAENGAVIHFLNKNPYDEWSFSYTINDLNLSPNQVAGVYLWYSKEPLSPGTFKGGDPKFSGVMAGIEYTGHAVELVVASNDGSTNIHPLEEHSLLRDSINQERLKNVREITVKVIKTTHNFKMELYNGENLLYDNLRFKDSSSLGDMSKGKYFSISSYYNQVPLNKKFILKKAQLYKREEYEHYEPLVTKSAKPETKLRMFDEVNHTDQDIRHLISNLEHYLEYIRTILGGPAGQSITNASDATLLEIERVKENLKTIMKELQEEKAPILSDSIDEISLRISDAENRLTGMQQGLNNITSTIDKLITSSQKRFKVIVFGVIGIIGAVVIFSAIEKYYRFKNYNRIN